ncbi:MAG: hypothetical protein M0Z27_13135 [Thermaerobacter sp.]|nr:hypothetical protein [Thermaerobacter sp.]
MRRTYANLALGSGTPIKALGAQLGRTTTRMTLDTYARLLPEAQREALNRLRAARRGTEDTAPVDLTAILTATRNSLECQGDI